MRKLKEAIRSPYCIFTLLLLGKMALLRYDLFHEVRINQVMTDLSGALILTGFVELLASAKMKKAAYWTVNLILSVIFFAAALYFEYYGTVLTYTTIFQLKQLSQVSSSVKSMLEWADSFYFLDFAAAMLAVLFTRRKASVPTPKPLGKLLVSVLMIYSFLSLIWTVKTSGYIVNEIKRAQQIGFLNYQVVEALAMNKSSNPAETLEEVSNSVQALMQNYPYQTSANSNAAPQYFGSQKGKNVILVQLEAFQNFPIHLSLNGQTLTPVLNKLADESFYFPLVYQQVGQGNTSDAEFASNTSIYPTGDIAMSTGYGNRDIPSLPKLLESLQYETQTFHVNDVTFWDRNKLYPAIGFNRFFDKPYFVNDQFNAFGASDEELYREGIKVLAELKQQNKPFYAQFITASSHHPFQIPEQKQTLVLPESLKGTQLGDYLQAIHYTDYALGTFIDRLKANGLWDNTVFVVYGDHFGLQPQDNDPEKIGEELGIHYDPYLSRYNIPLIVHAPGQKGLTINQVGGQVDIMPTVANLLGISLQQENFVHFGQDLLNIDRNIIGIRYYLPTGSFINNDILFVPGNGFDDGTAVSLQTMQPVNDFGKYRSDYDYILSLMNLSDRYVNLLPKRQV